MKQQHGLSVTIQVAENVPVPSDDLRELLFQTIRELLFNVVKHAGVTTALVSLAHLGEQIQIQVVDQGRGFDLSAEAKESSQGESGQGLLRIRQRLQLVGGTLVIESTPGRGTQVTMNSPLRSVSML
jgi:two-component system CheB/CheR fusion protein